MAAWSEARERHEQAWLGERRMDLMATIARARTAQDQHDRRPGTQLSVLHDARPEQTRGPESLARPPGPPSVRPLSEDARGEDKASKLGVSVPPQPGRATAASLPATDDGPQADGEAATGPTGTPTIPSCGRRPSFYAERRCQLPRGHRGRCQ